jgi:hypothetical protein
VQTNRRRRLAASLRPAGARFGRQTRPLQAEKTKPTSVTDVPGLKCYRCARSYTRRSRRSANLIGHCFGRPGIGRSWWLWLNACSTRRALASVSRIPGSPHLPAPPAPRYARGARPASLTSRFRAWAFSGAWLPFLKLIAAHAPEKARKRLAESGETRASRRARSGGCVRRLSARGGAGAD